MMHHLKNILLNNVPIKGVSLILGYTVWYIFGNAHITTVWIQVPLCFYSVPETMHISSSDTVSIKIAGKREHLYAIDPTVFAIHIDGQTLQQGRNFITLDSTRLFLPDTIKLINYYPVNLIVDVSSLNKDKDEFGEQST